MGFDEINNGNSFFRSTEMLKQIKFSTNPIKQEPVKEPEQEEEINIELAFTRFREAKAGINHNETDTEVVSSEQVNKPAVSFVEQSNAK